MNEKLTRSKFAITAFVLSLAFLGIYSFKFYESGTNEITSELEKIATEQGSVAGIETKNELSDLTNQIPMFPNSEIAGVNKSNNQIFLTLETGATEDQIKTYYDDYFLTNEWESTENNTYTKNGKILKIDISKGVINITYTT